MSDRKKLTKTQREFLDMCSKRPASGLSIDVIWVPESYCGVTESCETAAALSRRSQELPALGHSSSNGAWDALRTLARSAAHPGTCYWNLAQAAVETHAERTRNGCIFAFDNAQGFMDCSSVDLSNTNAGRPCKWDRIVTAFEDAQRVCDVPVRLIFFVYKAQISVRRVNGTRRVRGNEWRFPTISGRFRDRVQGWDWGRNGLVKAKQRSEFAYFEQVEVANATDRKAALA